MKLRRSSDDSSMVVPVGLAPSGRAGRKARKQAPPAPPPVTTLVEPVAPILVDEPPQPLVQSETLARLRDTGSVPVVDPLVDLDLALDLPAAETEDDAAVADDDEPLPAVRPIGRPGGVAFPTTAAAALVLGLAGVLGAVASWGADGWGLPAGAALVAGLGAVVAVRRSLDHLVADVLVAVGLVVALASGSTQWLGGAVVAGAVVAAAVGPTPNRTELAAPWKAVRAAALLGGAALAVYGLRPGGDLVALAVGRTAGDAGALVVGGSLLALVAGIGGRPVGWALTVVGGALALAAAPVAFDGRPATAALVVGALALAAVGAALAGWLAPALVGVAASAGVALGVGSASAGLGSAAPLLLLAALPVVLSGTAPRRHPAVRTLLDALPLVAVVPGAAVLLEGAAGERDPRLALATLGLAGWAVLAHLHAAATPATTVEEPTDRTEAEEPDDGEPAAVDAAPADLAALAATVGLLGAAEWLAWTGDAPPGWPAAPIVALGGAVVAGAWALLLRPALHLARPA